MAGRNWKRGFKFVKNRFRKPPPWGDVMRSSKYDHLIIRRFTSLAGGLIFSPTIARSDLFTTEPSSAAQGGALDSSYQNEYLVRRLQMDFQIRNQSAMQFCTVHVGIYRATGSAGATGGTLLDPSLPADSDSHEWLWNRTYFLEASSTSLVGTTAVIDTNTLNALHMQSPHWRRGVDKRMNRKLEKGSKLVLVGRTVEVGSSCTFNYDMTWHVKGG